MKSRRIEDGVVMARARGTAISVVRLMACLGGLGLLSACGGGPQMTAKQETAQYVARAKRDYAPPGPPSDPWGPYVVEAAAKYDMPERWVREVMRQESGGRMYENGKLITSSAGAMGLMQVMPGTFDELRSRYDLGDDPFDPHDNIMAGTAYLRELYDMFGSPGFLAAYNAGPGRFDDYLNRNRPLPDETRNYVARIGRRLGDDLPGRTSSSQLAMNQVPINIPAGPRYPRGRGNAAPVALAENKRTGYTRQPVQVASLPEPPQAAAAPQPQQLAALTPAPGRRGFNLIAPAMADTIPTQRGVGGAGSWAIQVGAYGNESLARAAAEAAKDKARDSLASAHPAVGSVKQGNATLYRARLAGLSHEAALQACEKLAKGRTACIVLSPGAQS